MKQTSDRIVTSDRVVHICMKDGDAIVEVVEDSARQQTSDRIVHICMEDGDDVDRVVGSWIEVGDVDT